MRVEIELTEESHDLLVRHFRDQSPVREALNRAARKEIAGVAVYAFSCDLPQVGELLEMARNHCPPAVKDIEHAIEAATRR